MSSWDKNLHLYEIQGGENGSGTLVNKYEHRAPVLDTCFGASDDEAFTAGMDWQVKRYVNSQLTLEDSLVLMFNLGLV